MGICRPGRDGSAGTSGSRSIEGGTDGIITFAGRGVAGVAVVHDRAYPFH